jgi:transglutaminase-like putative cysteine protease
VPKAILLAACCRALEIPARLGFADVRNHLSTARMRAHMKTDVFVWHGYTSIYIDENWVKATPAFNIELCEKFRLKPLDFDGGSDSIYHPFDQLGNKHMEYIRNRGEFPDVPIDKIIETFQRHYSENLSSEGSDFDKDVDQEVLAG